MPPPSRPLFHRTRPSSVVPSLAYPPPVPRLLPPPRPRRPTHLPPLPPRPRPPLTTRQQSVNFAPMPSLVSSLPRPLPAAAGGSRCLIAPPTPLPRPSASSPNHRAPVSSAATPHQPLPTTVYRRRLARLHRRVTTAIPKTSYSRQRCHSLMLEP